MEKKIYRYVPIYIIGTNILSIGIVMIIVI